MRGTSGRRSTGALAGALVGAVVLSGCQTMPFKAHPPRPGDPVLGLGAPLPYVRPGPSRPPRIARPTATGATATGLAASRTADRTPDVYAATRGDMFSPAVRHFPQRVYVPNSQSDTVDVIDPETYTVVRRFRAGRLPQYVVPSWDLRTLWVNDDQGNGLVPIDPRTGQRGKAVRVAAPHDLYFTADGRHALVMAERLNRIDIRAPHSMKLQGSVPVPCRGVNHADLTVDGSYALASCEFSGRLIKVDLRRRAVIGMIDLASPRPTPSRTRLAAPRPMPQDVKLSPDGTVFYVSDPASDGVWVIDAVRFREIGFIVTGRGAYGLYPSRDGEFLYVTNRGDGTISLISFTGRQVVGKWRLPDGGSPDLGAVSADGKVLWLSGRHDGVVYAVSTRTGTLIRRIKVGKGPHGLCVYPQPGRYSLGHGLR
jgi:YVTN family beta-propeller protein